MFVSNVIQKPHPFVSEKLQNFQKTKEGRIIQSLPQHWGDLSPFFSLSLSLLLYLLIGRQTVALVREFLEFFQLDFTTAVFDPETNAVSPSPSSLIQWNLCSSSNPQ